jgi:hypothetical protein
MHQTREYTRVACLSIRVSYTIIRIFVHPIKPFHDVVETDSGNVIDAQSVTKINPTFLEQKIMRLLHNIPSVIGIYDRLVRLAIARIEYRLGGVGVHYLKNDILPIK